MSRRHHSIRDSCSEGNLLSRMIYLPVPRACGPGSSYHARIGWIGRTVTLKTLLEQHVSILGRDIVCGTDEQVFDLDGRQRILDLMLYRSFPQTVPECHEHLVIELKAPTCTINNKEIDQIKRYAYSCYEDKRFDKDNTRWTFLLIGNKLGRYAELECSVDGRQRGHIMAANKGTFNVHVREWSSILANTKWRYEFFRSRLEYEASTADGLAYLKRKHSEYLPHLTAANENDVKAPRTTPRLNRRPTSRKR